MTDLEKRYNEAEEKIKQAQIEIGVRKKQLEELLPKRKEYEKQSLDKFNVEIGKINEYIIEKEAEGEKLIQKLEQELEEAQKTT